MLGSSSWAPYAPQGVKGTDDDDTEFQPMLNRPVPKYHVSQGVCTTDRPSQ